MMEFQTNQQRKPIKKEFEGCEVKLRRDGQGRIVGMRTSGSCTKEQVEFMRESLRQRNPEFNQDSNEDY